MDNFCGSTFWDSNLTWNTDTPVLSKCAEQTLLAWIPCAFIFLAAMAEVYFMRKSRERDVPWNALNICKIAAALGLAVLCGIDLVFNILSNDEVHPVHIVTPLLRITSYVLSALIVVYLRKYGLRTSGVQFIFYLLGVLAALSPLRTVITEKKYDYFFYSAVLQFALLLLSFLMACFADLPPRISPYERYKSQNPEWSAGFPSRLTFTWFDPMAMIGFRRDITEADLWDLSHEDTSVEVCGRFDKHYYRDKQNKMSQLSQPNAHFKKSSTSVNFVPVSTGVKEVSVLPALWKAFGAQFLAGSFMRLIFDLLTFVQPQLLSLLISFVEGDEPIWRGYLYASLFIIVSTTASLIVSQYFMRMSLVGMKIRSALTAALYRKALVLSPSARRMQSVGEIVNLMAIDAHRFIDLMGFINMAWSDVLQVCLALYFLWAQLGIATLAGLAVMICLLPVNGFIASRSKKLQLQQMKYKDQRSKMMNELINGIKVLKMYAWENAFGEEISKIRAKEIKILKKVAYLNASVSFIMTSTPFFVSFVSFGCYVLIDENNVLDSKRAFVSLALFNMLRMPMSMFPMVIAMIVQASVAVKRINKFLNAEELDVKAVERVLEDDKDMTDTSLIIENGYFRWDGGEKESFELRSINLRVKTGALVGLVGAVGSGKSSLIAAALGDIAGSGRVRVKGTVASVPQQPWIINATLKNNVLVASNSKYDEKRYMDVLERCALESDLAALPAGDQTEIGEKGVNLSGGQKARVALARAVYAKRDVYFLDDPLSAVDAHVGRHLFDRVIGPDSVLNDTTRIWATHSLTYLPKVDYIIVLKDGRVAEEGTFKQLLEKKGDFADFLLTHLADDNQELGDADVSEFRKELESELGDEFQTKLHRMRSVSSGSSDRKANVEGDVIRSNFSRQQSDVSRRNNSLSRHTSEMNGKPDEFQRQTSAIKSQSSEVNRKKSLHQLIESEKTETGGVKWEVYKYYAKNVGTFAFVAVILFNAIMQAFQIGTNFWLSRWSTDNTTLPDGSQDKGKRDMYLGVYGALGVAQVICITWSAMLMFIYCLRAAKVLHDALLARVLRAPTTTFFDITPLGRILNRFTKDVDTVDSALTMTLRQWLSCLFSVGGSFVVISIASPYFLIVLIPLSVAYFFIQRFYVAISRQLKRLESITRSPIISHFSESIGGASSIRAYQLTDRFIKESYEKVDRNQVCYYPSFVANRWLAVRLELLGNLIAFFTALFAVMNKGSPSSHLVGLSVSYALQITASLNWLVRMTADVETNIVAVERIKEYTEVPQEAAWEDDGSKVDESWPKDGAVELESLTISYRPELPPVLRNITCNILPGEKVGVVGRTGAGKSTLALALFRIVEASNGRIRVDGADVAQLGLGRLRSRITVIPQDPVLFSGTLRSNLDPFDKHSDSDLWRALELAGLRSMAEALPAGLRHEVSEGGDNLSLGQRQLVCLARALLRRSKLLLLDEATAAVDLETDAALQRTIRIEFKDATVLTIAHRLDTIMDYDRIMVLDKGKLIEFDTPANLLADRNTIFFSLAREAGLAH